MKGQISIEAIIAIILAIAAFSLISVLTYDKELEVKETENFLGKKNLCLKLSNNLNSIYTSGDGAVSKIKTEYDAFFDGPGREIFVEDARCSIPISKVTNGINDTFTIPKGTLQLENRDDTVYVSSNCIITNPEYAEVGDINTSLPKIVTNLVKKDDNKYAQVRFISLLDSEEIGNSQLYEGGNNVNIAYLRLGGHCTQSELEALLDEYACENYDENVGVTKCDIFFNANSIKNDFFDDELYKEYGIYVIEDVQNTLTDSHVSILENETSNGKWVFFSGRFGNDGIKFNVNYFKDDGDGPAVVLNYTDPFFQLQEGQVYYETLSDAPATLNNSIDSYIAIANFSNNYDAISAWDYGDGFVYFVSDICEEGIPSALKLAVESIIGLKGSGWIYARFQLVPLLNALSLESAEFSLNHKVNDTSIYLTNVTYRDIGEWTEICTNIPSSLDEITTTCSIESIVGERIETLVSFNASLSKSQEALVDVESIRVCYNDTA
ncbi:hypothetical protein J4414_02555 [Candidatus Woesearchaeota archaeon]|nr:hypothetical protein [Candidatus Woesearchaeota archaeon]